MTKPLDLTGQKFFRLTAIKSLGTKFDKKGKSRGRVWKCKCDCGKEIQTLATYLISGYPKSCGCWNKEQIIGRNVARRIPRDTNVNIIDNPRKKASSEEKLALAKLDRQKRRLAIITHYGGKCACCGEDTLEFLAVDHINGGGRKHKKEVKNFYSWLVRNNYPEGFQILCHNCNMSKGLYGKCPHEALDYELFDC